MLAAQQEQMRICGDIHGVDLNLAFQNSTPFWVTTSGVSTIPFTKNRTKGQYFDMLELFNIGGEIPVPWTIKLPIQHSLTMFPQKIGEVYGTRHEGEELHFHGRFCGPRSAISKS